MLHEDLQTLIDRLDRIHGALQLGCDSLVGGHRAEVADAMVDTMWESVRIAHEMTRRLAYDDLWNDLTTIVAVWRRVEDDAQRLRTHDVRAVTMVGLSQMVADGLARIAEAVDELDAAQLITVARPRDADAARRAVRAIDDLEAAADRFFVGALLDEAHGRVDAALAVLTTVAARAARERAAGGARRP